MDVKCMLYLSNAAFYRTEQYNINLCCLNFSVCVGYEYESKTKVFNLLKDFIFKGPWKIISHAISKYV